jgi:hypothetical protein
MSSNEYPPFTRLDSIKEFLFRFAAKGIIPFHWINKNLPEQSSLAKAELPIKLEIVSHCWNYSDFLTYQLSSLAKYPVNKVTVTHTVFYSEEDRATSELLAYFSSKQITNVHWNFIALPTEQLMRRAIGRNIAAKQTKADWVWFTDCDVVFHQGSLDSLAEQLHGRQDYLVYPRKLLATELLQKDDPLLADASDELGIKEVDMTKFSDQHFSRATGPIQIAHGDVARACGYCDDLKIYQTTVERWKKTYDDRAFRWLINSQGVAIDVPNVLFIRHAEKGRYKKDSAFSRVRKLVRKIKSSVFGLR